MRNDFVVYAHLTKDTSELFYIGEGTIKRAYSKWSRNRYWNNKVSKHGGFSVVILHRNLTKDQSEELETVIIKQKKAEGVNLANFCIGPMFKNHWLAGAPKEVHPMFGKKIPKASERIKKWNKEHSGEKSPTFGLKRPDLVARNKTSFNGKKIKCIETGEIFDSIKKASGKFGRLCSKSLRNNGTSRGFHWEYITAASSTFAMKEEQNTEAV